MRGNGAGEERFKSAWGLGDGGPTKPRMDETILFKKREEKK